MIILDYLKNNNRLHEISGLVSLASGIAAKHPDMGLCQLDKLKHMGIPDSQINTVIEIARHIRDEAAQKLDTTFDEKSGTLTTAPENSTTACCTSTASGQSYC